MSTSCSREPWASASRRLFNDLRRLVQRVTRQMAVVATIAFESDSPGVVPAAPGRAWWALTLLIVATVFSFVDRQIFSLVADPMSHELGLTNAELGLLQGLGLSFFMVIGGLPLGWLADRMNRSVLLGGCVLAWSISTLACGLAQNFTQLLLATIGVAFGEGALVPVIYSLIPDLFPRHQRVHANSIYFLAAVLGAALGLAVCGATLGVLESAKSTLPAFNHIATWRLAFFAVALPGPVLALAILSIKAKRGVAASPGHERPMLGLKSYLRRHWLACINVFCGFGLYALALAAGVSWLPIMLTREFGETPSKVGIRLGIAIGLGTCIGIVTAFLLARRLDHRSNPTVPLLISRYAFLLSAVPIFLMLFARTPLEIYVLFATLIVASMAASSLMPNILQDMVPRHLRARLIAINSIVSVCFSGAGPILLGVFPSAGPASAHPLITALVVISLPCCFLGGLLMKRSERPVTNALAEFAEI
jgi:MFS family permease